MGDMILYRSTNGVGNNFKKYKVMTVVINEADSNSTTCCSYADDAVNMPNGGSANDDWREFFGYKPCLFKNGQVVDYLNPNDYSKFENGGSADITSGNAGDVMIEFPRRGIRCVKDGTTIRISMTDAPNDPDFKYYAHQRGTVSKDAFYLGAYGGTIVDGKMRSLSGHNITSFTRYDEDVLLESVRKYTKANWDDYLTIPYSCVLYIQFMYVLQFKRLDSMAQLGGHQINPAYASTGSHAGTEDYFTGEADTNGLYYLNDWKTLETRHTTSSKTFGMENLLSFDTIVEGAKFIINTEEDAGMFIAGLGLEVYDNSIENYTLLMFFPDKYDDGYVSSVLGSTAGCFLPVKFNGSSSTYYRYEYESPGNYVTSPEHESVVCWKHTLQQSLPSSEKNSIFLIKRYRYDQNGTLPVVRLCYI